MSNSYFDSAKIWYSSSYLDSYYSRFFYLAVLLFNIACLALGLSVYNNTPSGIEKIYIVAKINLSDAEFVSVKENELKDNELNILKFAITKSIETIESFDYDSNFIEKIKQKNEILKNIFSDEIADEYIENNDEYNLSSDLYYAQKGMSKEVSIQKIKFLDNSGGEVTESLKYKIFGLKNIKYAEVLFSIYNKEIEEELSYKAILKYNLEIPKKNKDEQLLFKITEYSKEKIEEQS